MKRILVAEDSPRIRETITRYLREAGFDTLVATTGLEALRIVRDERPDVILLDGLLPQLHGFELARLVRAVDPGYHPAIVLVSGIYTNHSDRADACRRYGITHFVSKPFTREQLLEAVDQAARQIRAA
ncbi:MAG TPA: response regulator [Thermoanaerobaculia bacterium]|nr:response regulator [Thermoanaerobaculia bacterium]